MRYTLWHTDTANLIGDFGSLDEALFDVRAEIETNDDAEELLLQIEERPPRLIAGGEELRVMAYAAVAQTQAVAHNSELIPG